MLLSPVTSGRVFGWWNIAKGNLLFINNRTLGER